MIFLLTIIVLILYLLSFFIIQQVVYKIPRLKEGAIPSIFPNCPKYLSNSLNPRKLPLIRRSSPKNPKADKKKDPKMNCSFTSDQSKVIGIIDSIEIFSFSKLQENINSIVFPNGWSRHDIPGKLIMFSFFIVKTKDILIENYVPTPILYKRVCLGFNLNVQCFVMNMSVNTDLFGSNKLNCSKDLEDILKQFDTSIICKGYKLKEKLLHSKTTYTDPAGNFRHIMCPLILNQNNDCKYCNKAIQTIMVNCYI